MADLDRPISRLPAAPHLLENPLLVELFARMRAQGRPILNIHRTVAHAPRMLAAQAAYAGAMREHSSLPRGFQELLILHIAEVNDSEYEQSVHRSIAAAHGISTAKIKALPAWRGSTLFDERERAALAFVEQAASAGDVDDEVFGATQAIFSAQEIVEIAALVAWYVGNSRLVRALRIAPERE
jgi:alkylhydroperoxidase family enzyme